MRSGHCSPTHPDSSGSNFSHLIGRLWTRHTSEIQLRRITRRADVWGAQNPLDWGLLHTHAMNGAVSSKQNITLRLVEGGVAWQDRVIDALVVQFVAHWSIKAATLKSLESRQPELRVLASNLQIKSIPLTFSFCSSSQSVFHVGLPNM